MDPAPEMMLLPEATCESILAEATRGGQKEKETQESGNLVEKGTQGRRKPNREGNPIVKGTHRRRKARRGGTQGRMGNHGRRNPFRFTNYWR